MKNQHQIYKSFIICFCVISSLERLTLTKGQPRGPGSQGSKGGFFAANWAFPYHYQTFSYIPYSLPCVCLLSGISLQLLYHFLTFRIHYHVFVVFSVSLKSYIKIENVTNANVAQILPKDVWSVVSKTILNYALSGTRCHF